MGEGTIYRVTYTEFVDLHPGRQGRNMHPTSSPACRQEEMESAMNLLAQAAQGETRGADEPPPSAKSSVVRNLGDADFDATSIHEEVDPDGEDEEKYLGSPAKSVRREGDDGDGVDEEIPKKVDTMLPTTGTTTDDTARRRGRSSTSPDFVMPAQGDRVEITYDDGAKFFATTYYPAGWKQENTLLVFDDGDYHSFSKTDLKRCAMGGNYKPVTEEHPLYGKGCVSGMASAPVADISITRSRGGAVRVDGVWLGQEGYAGKEKIPCFQTFVASEKSRAEFKTFLQGGLVRYGPTEVGITLRVLRCPMGADESKTRFMLIVAPVAEACAGVMPCVTTEYLKSDTARLVVPFSKAFSIAVVDDEEMPVEAECIREHIVGFNVQDNTYYKVAPDSQFWEQLVKSTPTHILDDVLLRGQVQAGRKRGPPSEGGGGGGGGGQATTK